MSGDGDIRVVLVRTSHPGNIGAAARAMRTMGLTRLDLVAPQAFPHAEATAMAAGADDVLANARVVPTLADALSDCVFALGSTARARAVAMPELSPRAAMAQVLAERTRGAVALVFGNERTGLTNDELQQCHAAVCIPSMPEFSSLNLAAAVQVLCYEWRLAQRDETLVSEQESVPESDAQQLPSDRAATLAEIEAMFVHLEAALEAIDFFKGRVGTTIMRRLRRLFLRAHMSEREVAIVRGILSDAQRTATLARRG
jgi:tRNA (cytidine32/uridine32-2'-O)-methyltransferase